MGDQDAPDQGQPQDAALPNQNNPAPGASPQGGSDTAKKIGITGDQEASNITNNIGEAIHTYRDQINNYFKLGDDAYKQIEELLTNRGGDFSEVQRLTGAFHSHRGPRPDPPKDMPESYEKLVEWFFDPEQLNKRERCMVYATAILHGAPAMAINTARQELYTYLYPAKKHDKDRDAQPVEQERPGDLFKRTFTKFEDFAGVQRFVWRDADQDGVSPFGLQVLRLVAEEMQGIHGFSIQTERHLIDKIQDWALDTSNPEYTWRAAFALGVIKWIINPQELRTTLGTWARATGEDGRQKRNAAAWMICGAYEIELDEEQHEHLLGENRSKRTPIIATMLREWSASALLPVSSSAKDADVGLASTVVMAYGRLGLSRPEFGLDGLDYLLGLRPANPSKELQLLTITPFILAIEYYIWLAHVRHTRTVIEHLAGHVSRLNALHPRGTAPEVKNERTWRAVGLSNAYLIFFILVIGTFENETRLQADNEADNTPHYGATPTLPAILRIPYAGRLDTVLAGILAQEEEALHSQLITLLTLALYHWNPIQVRLTLKEWAETFYRQPYYLMDLGERYSDFLAALGMKAQELDNDQGMIDAREQNGLRIYIAQLNQWPRNKPTRIFAERALFKLERLAR